jgi:hypothetical protein
MMTPPPPPPPPGLVLHAQSDLLVRGKLLVLGRKLLGVHEQELGAEEANALGIVLRRHVRVVRVADVRDEKNLLAVAGHGLLAAVGLESGLLLRVGLSLRAIVLQDVVLGVVDDLAEGAVDDDHLAGLDVLRGIRDGKDCGDLECTGDNGGVGGAATGLGDDARDVLLVDVGGHRGA